MNKQQLAAKIWASSLLTAHRCRAVTAVCDASFLPADRTSSRCGSVSTATWFSCPTRTLTSSISTFATTAQMQEKGKL